MDDFLEDIEREERERESELESIKQAQMGMSKDIPNITDKKLFPLKSISQSLIKEITSHRDDPDLDLNFNQKKEYCPLQVFYKFIARVLPDMPTENMQKGLYFETKLLGSSAKGKSYHEAPKKARGLGIPMDYERINKQIELAKEVFFENFINITPFNVQVPLSVYHPKLDITITMEMDIFPTPILHDNELKLSIVDLKLTGDVNNTSGDYCWGSPKYMDHIQGDLYQYFCNYVFNNDKAIEQCKILNPKFNYDYVFNHNIIKMARKEKILFYYIVFGYSESVTKGNNLETQKRIIQREWTHEREYSMIKRLCYVIEILREEESKGWQAVPSSEKCLKCPLKGKICNKFNEVIKI